MVQLVPFLALEFLSSPMLGKQGKGPGANTHHELGSEVCVNEERKKGNKDRKKSTTQRKEKHAYICTSKQARKKTKTTLQGDWNCDEYE